MVEVSMAVRSPEIDAYLSAAVEPARSRLVTLRDLIAAEAPEATETMSYAMPTWHQGENLVHIAGFARHVGLYPGPEAIEAFATELTGFPTSKGAIQLPHAQPLPLDLVRRIVRWRVERARERARHGKAPRPMAEALRDPGPLTFEAELLRSDSSGAACFVLFPWPLRETFGRGNLVPVEACWDGTVTYRGSLAMMGGEKAMLLCRKDVLAGLGKSAGDRVHVVVRLDTAPREVELPEALQKALDAHDEARAAWPTLSPSCRRDYADWIADAKREATRDARVEKAVVMIAARKRLKG